MFIGFLVFLFLVSLIGLFFSIRDYCFTEGLFGEQRDKTFDTHNLVFLGRPVTFWTTVFFSLLLFLTLFVFFKGDKFLTIVFILLLFGSLFSFYLMTLRLFVEKALLSLNFLFGFTPVVLLALFIFFTPIETIFYWFEAFYDSVFLWVTLISIMGTALALVSFFVFIFFMKDMLISKKEATVLSLISDALWLFVFTLLSLGIILITVTVGVFEIQIISLIMGIIAVVAVCEFTKVLRIRPSLRSISLNRGKIKKIEKESLKRLAFGVESISLICWLSVSFFLLMPVGRVDIFQATGMYMLLVVIAFLLSQLTSSNLYGDDK